MTLKRMLVTVLTVGALSVAPGLYGQDDKDKKQKPQQEQQADRPSETTLTGCLTEQSGSFVIATEAGEQVNVTGSDLAKHKDHTVKLTGTKSDEGGKSTLRVSKIDHVSASCSK